MDRTLVNFVSTLRKAEVEVSPAEMLDAVVALDIVGIQDRQMLRRSLSILLAKTPEEKELFEVCFRRFFSFQQFEDQPDYLEHIRADLNHLESQQGDRLSGGEEEQRRRGSHRRHEHQISRLGHILLSGDRNELAVALANAAHEVHLEKIKALRERSLYTHRILLHLGINQLNEEINQLIQRNDEESAATGQLLQEARLYLTEQIRAYVEEQYLLIVDGSGQRFIADAVTRTRFTDMQPYYFEHIREVIRKLAHQLAKRHARKRKMTRRGQLDVRKTLRKNLAYNGVPFNVQWKQIKLERPRIFVVCDVSGSVRNVSRFLLTFLYSLNELLPDVRSFAFSNELGEISSFFKHYPLDEAIEMSLDDYGKGSTDYGSAFRTFKDLCLKEVDSRSTVIILGDSRNNYYATGVETIKEISQKSKQLIWLNPEPRGSWQEGDAEMQTYLPYCHIAEVCNSLVDLERLVSRVLHSSR